MSPVSMDLGWVLTHQIFQLGFASGFRWNSKLAPDVRKGMKVKLSKVYKSCSDAQSLGLWRLRLAEGWSLRREFKPQESRILPIFFFFFEGGNFHMGWPWQCWCRNIGLCNAFWGRCFKSLAEISSLFPEVKVYSMCGIVFFQHQKPSPSCG